MFLPEITRIKLQGGGAGGKLAKSTDNADTHAVSRCDLYDQRHVLTCGKLYLI